MKEEWEYIDGYDKDYMVSNTGRVKSLKRKNNIEISKSKNNWGYFKVTLYKDGDRNSHILHRLVAQAFVNNPNDKPEVNHIDGDKSNNNASNLEWCSRSENAIHAYENGIMKVGEGHGRSKITEDDVYSIRMLYRSGLFTQKELADDFGLSQSYVGKIINKENWTHV